ncbi:pyrroline-5-carboxylate reductase 3-like isoform X2 [Pollicipes pollicipes]|nr:pyrroline-5-carboxylate reductase 3-like isoform X2 [Pollicipes pollicipes]XP_037070587.1 pyrroline-5-carboxylate reductase 3-like isoform X2 [Pollicipes pollicipes]XP_037070588.1 pyrroline-5-carboxylate reductase 3-like isoform X2 [Pollicipes pollicipes]XP_037070589.1 pyrroline-5-carboxylate reductase 3-like isoform X2 [Pollicipes pollicipes]
MDDHNEPDCVEDPAHADADAEINEQGLHVTVKQEMVKDYYLQKYKQEWELLPEFEDWLQPVPDDPYLAECRLCNTKLRCHKLKLRQHAKSKKHRASVALGARMRRNTAFVPTRTPRRSFGRRVTGPARGRGRPAGMRHVRDEADPADQLAPQDVSYSDTGRVTYSIGLGGNKVGFIGAGVLAQAVALAILDKGVIHSGRVTVSAPSSRHLSVWTSWGATVTNSNDVVMQTCDVVVLAVPTAAAEAALRALAPAHDCGERCFISLVPGLSRGTIEEILASKFVPPCPPGDVQTMGSMHVVRCMVNLAVRTGTGCCAYSVPAALPDRWLLCLEVMCGAMGVSQALDDARLDAFAAAFAGGPALALAFADALALGAASVGLPWSVARKMAAQTLLGTGHLMLDTDRSGEPLHDEAAPVGGATIAGLVALHETSIRSGVANAVQACRKALQADSH